MSDLPSDPEFMDDASRWDADDPRRQHDQMAPPAEPCECYCLHCQRTFMSDQIWFQKIIGSKDSLDGFWMCPTPNCSGAGFTFDIYPTDPDHPANGDWYDDDDYEDYYEEDEDEIESAWDPDESMYKKFDEMYGEEDDDIEGEEWKYGLEPGAEPPEPSWVQQARKEQEEEESRYNAPDERPRELDWSDREQTFTDDDIPF